MEAIDINNNSKLPKVRILEKQNLRVLKHFKDHQTLALSWKFEPPTHCMGVDTENTSIWLA